MPVDISPLMDRPGGSRQTPAQRKATARFLQDPKTSEEDRGAILQYGAATAACRTVSC